MAKNDELKEENVGLEGSLFGDWEEEALPTAKKKE
ncbi:hypothetical protein EVA_10550, partial [gut metagenome]